MLDLVTAPEGKPNFDHFTLQRQEGNIGSVLDYVPLLDIRQLLNTKRPFILSICLWR